MYDQPTLINLHPNEHSQELRYYPFVVHVGRCAWSCNTLNNLTNRVWVSNETEDVNFHVVNMKTRINESRSLTKHVSIKFEKM